MPLPESALLCVSERDVDLLILEEMIVDPSFREWLAGEAGLSIPAAADFVGAWHSVWDPLLGESDLVALWRFPDARRHALLLENKINAPAQPSQAERYLERGRKGVQTNDWDDFRTCVVAPARYLESTSKTAAYMSQVSYELVRDRLQAKGDPRKRAAYRASVIESAIQQQRRGYSPEIDESVSGFWREFWRLSLEHCPRIGMTEPEPKPAGAGWIWTRPPELGGRRWIAFKLANGVVDLQLDGAADRAVEIDQICRSRLGGEVRAVRTGKSTSLRLEVEPVDVMSDFEDQRAVILSVLDAAVALLETWKLIGHEIE